MWRVVCIGPGSMDFIRRVEDRGPLHPDEARAQSIAVFLRATGLYESVKVVGSTVKSAEVTTPDAPSRPAEAPGPAAGTAATDDLSSVLDESPPAEPVSPETDRPTAET